MGAPNFEPWPSQICPADTFPSSPCWRQNHSQTQVRHRPPPSKPTTLAPVTTTAEWGPYCGTFVGGCSVGVKLSCTASSRKIFLWNSKHYVMDDALIYQRSTQCLGMVLLHSILLVSIFSMVNTFLTTGSTLHGSKIRPFIGFIVQSQEAMNL